MASRQTTSSKPLDKPIDEFNKNVTQAVEYAADENRQFEQYYQLVYKNSLLQSDINALQSDDRPTFNFPILKPYLMRALKNVVDSMPSVSVNAYEEDEENAAEVPNDMQALLNGDVADILTMKLQDIYERSQWNDQVYAVSKDAFVGGKGVFKVSTKYINKTTFAQEILVEACDLPQHIYFDPAAKEPNKSDGSFVFEMVPFSESAFIDKFGENMFEQVNVTSVGKGFNWVEQDKNAKEKTVWVCDYYWKKVSHKTLYLLADGHTTYDKPMMGEEIADEREIEDCEIYLVRFVRDVILEEEHPLNFKHLPFSQCPGELYYDQGVRRALPFSKPAIDSQRVKNFNMNFFLYEALSNRTGTDYIAEEALTNDSLTALENPTRKKVVVYKQFKTLDDGQRVELQPPRYEPAAPLPVQYLEAFTAMDGTIDKIMGSQFPSVDQLDASGKALYNMADFMSAANEGFIQNLLLSITHVSEIILGAMPETLSSQQVTVGGENDNDNQLLEYAFDFDPSLFHVAIKRGVNYKLQQQATVEQLINLAEVSPPFAEFLYSQGMVYLLENMSMNDKDKLIEAFKNFQQQQQEQPQPPDPKLMLAQAKMMDAQVKAQELPLKAGAIQQKASAAQMKFVSDQDRAEAELAKAHLKYMDTVTKHPAGAPLSSIQLPMHANPYFMH